MRYLIDAAIEEGLQDILEQTTVQPQVHGVLVDIDPLWLTCWQLFQSSGRKENFADNILPQLEYFGIFGPLAFNSFSPPAVFATTAPMELDWRPKFWKAYIQRSNLLIKILLRPGSRPAELNYQGQLNVVQEFRAVPTFSATMQRTAVALEGGVSVGHGNDPAGTLGGILVDTQTGHKYGLTCGHVIRQNSYDVDSPSKNDPGKPLAIGTCLLSKNPDENKGAKCNAANKSALNQIDIALIKLSSPANFSVLNIGQISGHAPNNMLSPNVKTEFTGRSSSYKSLVIGGISVIQEIKDFNQKTCCMSDLIEIREPSVRGLVFNQPVKPGDSGAWLVVQGQSGNEWCGMVIAEDRQSGYAMTSENVLKFLKNHSTTKHLKLQCC